MRSAASRSHSPKHVALASTAGALIALVAVAALMSSVPGAPLRPATAEGRITPVESASVRAVAAAVAAAARDLVGGERLTATLHPVHVIQTSVVAYRVSRSGTDDSVLAHSRPLAERLLDLPPPVC